MLYMPFKKRTIKRKFAKPRRRLGVGTAAAYAPYVVKAGLELKKRYDAAKVKAQKYKNRQYKRVRNENIALSDNITTLAKTVIGKQREMTFDEKVSRVERPPILFKRNYEFSAEAGSGRKSWFSMDFNYINGNDLNADLTTYKSQQYTDTATADPTAPATSGYDGAKFYVDFLSEKIQLMNSSSVSLFGKIHLYAHKRDGAGYAGAPMSPINMMMYYSTFRLPQNVTANEATLTNGWKFDTTTSTINWQANYNMPGSSIHPSSVCASTDPALSPSSPHVADGVDFWFRKVSSESFNLKPGQQINKSYIFNDLKDIMREEQGAFLHLAGISFNCVIEFQGQVAGDISSSTITSAATQLSVIRHSTRKLGIRNKLKSKIYLVTAPATVIAPVNTYIINPDTGVQDVGIDFDA